MNFYLESKYWTVSLPGVKERGQKGGISKEQLVENGRDKKLRQRTQHMMRIGKGQLGDIKITTVFFKQQNIVI